MTDATLDDVSQAICSEIKNNTAELKRVANALQGILGSLENKAYVTQTEKAVAPNAAPLNSRDTTPTPRAINWRKFKTGTPGGWCYTTENEPLRDTLLAAKSRGQMSVVLENHTYRLSGDEDQFIQRFPVGGRKA